MDFKFNFINEEEKDETECNWDSEVCLNTDSLLLEHDKDSKVPSEQAVLHCERGFTLVKVNHHHHKFITDNSLSVQNFQIQDYVVKLILPTEIKLSKFEGAGNFLAAVEHSDLIPDLYEGGLKVWECAHDLALYLAQHGAITPGMRVLELGCGAGLPGILALKCGSYVDFQDFNFEVLNFLTIPNVLLNVKEANIIEECKFIAGDWELIDKCIHDKSSEKNRYDVILTSETIYNPKNHSKLLNIMKHSLKPAGVIYVAAKTHYFGVGGGTRQFEDLVMSSGIFDIQQCRITSGGVQREILCMKLISAL